MGAYTVTQAGLEFGPNAAGKRYLSMNYHRGEPTPVKSTWHDQVSRPDEFAIFCAADVAQRVDSTGVYWGIRDISFNVLGSRGERIAKFPANGNANVPWHGYPASPNRKGSADLPPEDVLETLEVINEMARVWVRRLRAMKI